MVIRAKPSITQLPSVGSFVTNFFRTGLWIEPFYGAGEENHHEFAILSPTC